MIIDIISLRVIVESDINNRLHRSVYGINIENDDKNEEHNPNNYHQHYYNPHPSHHHHHHHHHHLDFVSIDLYPARDKYRTRPSP